MKKEVLGSLPTKSMKSLFVIVFYKDSKSTKHYDSLILLFVFQAQNSEYFSQYLTEDIHDYIARKRYQGVHGNHLEIQALSEMYNRPIHIYCYSSEPINIFQVI